MARRRVKSDALNPSGIFSGDPNERFNPRDLFADEDQYNEVLNSLRQVAGFVDTPQDVDDYKVPPLPQEPEQRLPQGIELLADYADTEAREDGLDAVAETDPYSFQAQPIPLGGEPAYSMGGSPVSPPQGLEMVGDLAEIEAEEDALDSISETEPPIEGIPPAPEEELGGLPPAIVEAANRGPLEEVTEQDMPNEGLEAVPGAVAASKDDPRVINTVNNLLRTQGVDVDPMMMQWAETAEGAITKQLEDLNQEEQAFRQKLETKSLDKNDKVALGIALAIPVIMALFMGPGVLVGALGGLGKGYLESVQQQGKEREAAQKGIGEIEKKRAGLDEKRLSIAKDLLASERNPELRKFYSQYDIIRGFTEDGQVIVGDDARVFGDGSKQKVGVRGEDEEGVLWYDTNRLKRDKDRETFDEKVEDGREVIRKLSETQENVDDISNIMEAMKEQNPGLYEAARSKIAQALPDQNLVDLLGKEQSRIKITLQNDDGTVTEVDAIPMLSQKIGMLMDTYRTGFLTGTRYSGPFEQHWKSVFSDPSDVKEWLSQDLETMQAKAKSFEASLMDRMIGTLVKDGFIREPLEERFKPVRSEPLSQAQPRAKARRDILQDTERMKSFITPEA